MEYRRLGRSGLKVSTLCLGAMMFGEQTNETDALEIVANAREAGVNFIDTADAYNMGKSEETVGRAIRGDRERWVIATKSGVPAGVPNVTGPSMSRGYILQAVERSLKRLGVDHIDLYYLHRDDMETPLEETVRAMADLQRQGKIRYMGVSNFKAWRIAELSRCCDDAGIDRPAACQPLYNIMNRMSEVELFPACRHYGVGVVSYSPLARGVLTGKYVSMDAPPEGSRAARGDRRILQTEFRRESLDASQRIKAYAEAHGVSTSHFALGWVLNNVAVDAVIAGPRTLAQWKDYLAGLETSLCAEDEAFVDGLVAPGHSSTPGFTDPQYPVTGRTLRL